MRQTERLCVSPASSRSWFQLVEDRAHTYSISPLLCEDSPGTGPTTSPNTHLLHALHARLHATLVKQALLCNCRKQNSKDM